MATAVQEIAAHFLAKRQSSSCGVNPSDDPGAATSATQILATLAPVALFALVYLVIFLLLRNKFPRYYRPRTFLGALRENERTPNVKEGLFNWFSEFFNFKDDFILTHSSLDTYLFLRFLKLAVIICLVGCAITFPVLLPVNATGGGGLQQFNVLVIGNVQNNYYRYFAHAGCAILFFGFVIYMITRESIFYINLRQAYLLSPLYASRISSRTVLYSSVPDEYLNEYKLRAMLGDHVVRIWFPTDTSDLEDKVTKRDTAFFKLEKAETKLIKLCNKANLKQTKKGGVRQAEEGVTTSEWTHWLPKKKYPTHKLGKFGLYGKKVETIPWCRDQLRELIPEVQKEQSMHQTAHESIKKLRSVFVEFDSVAEAQAAYQSLTHHQALHMSPRFTGMTPEEVIWSNLKIQWWERVLRGIVCTSFVCALIFFWAIPVAFVGALSNIKSVIAIPAFSWLSFLEKIPHVIFGVINGLLPTILLAVLMALLPIILRLVAKFSGDPTLSQVELTVQNYYFGFQVVQVFLVTTLGSAVTSSAPIIVKNPSCVTTLLAAKIPTASNFYLSYFILQGLGVVSSTLLSVTGLVIFMALGRLLDSTPRKMWKRWVTLSSVQWGTLFPIYTNLLVVALCYAAIAPIVVGFAAIGLSFFYIAYKYEFLFVVQNGADTKGLIYPRALQQLFVGLYIAEICLIGLFAIKAENPGAIGPLILMIAFLIFTALYQISLNAALGPLLQFLPKSLEAEERALLADVEYEGDSIDASAARTNGSEKKTNGLHPQNSVSAKHVRDGHPVPTGHSVGTARDPADLPGDTEKNLPRPYSSKDAAYNSDRPKANAFTRWLRPDKYATYHDMRRLVPIDFAHVVYDGIDTSTAYCNPAVSSAVSTIWVPRDEMGVSRTQCMETMESAPVKMTDEDAFFDAKGKIVWGGEGGRPPVWEPTVYW